MDLTTADWVEELRPLHGSQAAEAILSKIGTNPEHNVKTLADALTAWAILIKEELEEEKFEQYGGS
jgi:hypothetical protein